MLRIAVGFWVVVVSIAVAAGEARGLLDKLYLGDEASEKAHKPHPGRGVAWGRRRTRDPADALAG